MREIGIRSNVDKPTDRDTIVLEYRGYSSNDNTDRVANHIVMCNLELFDNNVFESSVQAIRECALKRTRVINIDTEAQFARGSLCFDALVDFVHQARENIGHDRGESLNIGNAVCFCG